MHNYSFTHHLDQSYIHRTLLSVPSISPINRDTKKLCDLKQTGGQVKGYKVLYRRHGAALKWNQRMMRLSSIRPFKTEEFIRAMVLIDGASDREMETYEDHRQVMGPQIGMLHLIC